MTKTPHFCHLPPSPLDFLKSSMEKEHGEAETLCTSVINTKTWKTGEARYLWTPILQQTCKSGCWCWLLLTVCCVFYTQVLHSHLTSHMTAQNPDRWGVGGGRVRGGGGGGVGWKKGRRESCVDSSHQQYTGIRESCVDSSHQQYKDCCFHVTLRPTWLLFSCYTHTSTQHEDECTLVETVLHVQQQDGKCIIFWQNVLHYDPWIINEQDKLTITLTGFDHKGSIS